MRRIRSKGRRRLATGKAVTLRQGRALLSHHASAPSLKRSIRRHMGKQGGHWHPWQKGAAYHKERDSSSWELWRGSWKSASPRSQKFPSYDMEWGSTPNILVVSEAQKAKDSEETSTKEVQSIVNMLRKAETKIAKLGRDKTEKTARWLAYQKQMKAAFVTEEKRFQATQAKIAEDLVEAERQLVTAKELLAAAASEFRTAPTAAASGNSATAEEAWETMLRRTEAEEPPASREEIAEILRRYKRGEGLPTSPLPTFGRGPEPVPMETDGMNVDKAPAPREAPTTNRAPHGDLSGPGGPSYGCASPSTGNARSTPYPEVPTTGPKLPTEPTREPPEPPDTHGTAHVENPDSRLPERVPLKQQAKAPPERPAPRGTSLSQKLDSRRGTAMDPFHRAKSDVPDESHEDKEHGRTTVNTINDTQDELLPASPGLGRLDA